MNDAFITALNTQYATVNWIDVLSENMTNTYTPRTVGLHAFYQYDGIAYHQSPPNGYNRSGEDYLYIIRYEGYLALVHDLRRGKNVKIYRNCINYSSPNSVCAYSQCPG